MDNLLHHCKISVVEKTFFFYQRATGLTNLNASRIKDFHQEDPRIFHPQTSSLISQNF